MPNWKYKETKFNKDMPITRRGTVELGEQARRKPHDPETIQHCLPRDGYNAETDRSGTHEPPKDDQKGIFGGEDTTRHSQLQSKHQSANT